jgi:hypothetical protein
MAESDAKNRRQTEYRPVSMPANAKRKGRGDRTIKAPSIPAWEMEDFINFLCAF